MQLALDTHEIVSVYLFIYLILSNLVFYRESSNIFIISADFLSCPLVLHARTELLGKCIYIYIYILCCHLHCSILISVKPTLLALFLDCPLSVEQSVVGCIGSYTHT